MLTIGASGGSTPSQLVRIALRQPVRRVLTQHDRRLTASRTADGRLFRRNVNMVFLGFTGQFVAVEDRFGFMLTRFIE